MKVVELKKLAREFGIPKAYLMKRHELLGRLATVASIFKPPIKPIESIHAVVQGHVVPEFDSKKRYRENATPGTLVAFRAHEKLMTAKIIDVHKRANTTELEVHTKNGTKFYIDVKNVLWFKTGARWPKSIFEELKGITHE